VPPEPRLQTHPVEDLAALRAREDAALHGYAWVDRDAGVTRIPVERAIEILVERGLPARPAPEGDPGILVGWAATPDDSAAERRVPSASAARGGQ
jgi:hypothetical protein